MGSANAERVAALESQLDSLEAMLADLQSSVDKKADGMLMYAVIGLLVVVIVLLLVMMVMGRKSPPPPPPSA